jgi:hypothetical protein
MKSHAPNEVGLSQRNAIIRLAAWIFACCLPMLAQSQPAESKKTADVDFLQDAAKTSVFVYDGAAKPCLPAAPGLHTQPVGSAFILAIEDGTSPDASPRFWQFLITAEHVIHGRSAIVLRFNHSGGKGKICHDLPLERTGQNQNLFLPSDTSVDLAAIFLRATPPDADYLSITYSWIMDPKSMQKYDLKVGTEVFTVGYLAGYAGESQNYPVTKFGRISVLTDEKWLFSNEREDYESAYIVELQNIPGLSGAPLLAYGEEFKMNPLRFRMVPPFLIGVVKDLLLYQDQHTKAVISQGLAGIEPGYKVKAFMDEIVTGIKTGGGKPNLEFNRLPEP